MRGAQGTRLPLARAKARQCRAEPLAGRHRCSAGAPYLVWTAAHAAVAASFLDKVFRSFYLVACGQNIELFAQMRLRLWRIVPSAIAVKLTARLFDKSEQIIDFYHGRSRWRRVRGGQHAQHHDHCKQR